MAGQRNPDIQRLLARLRGEEQPGVQGSPTDQTNNHDNGWRQGSNAITGQIPGLGLLPHGEPENQRATIPKISTPQPAIQIRTADLARSNTATPVVPDASIITTWSAGLRHVSRHIVSNEKACGKIKQLISEQHKHERQWWAGREAIVARQSGRAGNQAKVADLLKSLGGASVPVAAHDPKSDQAELDAYDRKVYKGLTDMAADFDRQLKGLQIPFFAIKHELVIVGNDESQKDGSNKGKIDRGELRELQRRMVETLEDLFSDD